MVKEINSKNTNLLVVGLLKEITCSLYEDIDKPRGNNNNHVIFEFISMLCGAIIMTSQGYPFIIVGYYNAIFAI